MKVHLIFVCKYRRKVLDANISSILKSVLTEISSKYQFDIDIMETDKDHIHLLISYDPKIQRRPNRSNPKRRVNERNVVVLRNVLEKILLGKETFVMD